MCDCCGWEDTLADSSGKVSEAFLAEHTFVVHIAATFGSYCSKRGERHGIDYCSRHDPIAAQSLDGS